jgi:predicted RNase H-like HicB family nuclease
MRKSNLPSSYIFPAIFEDAHKNYVVKFPNFPNCYASGKDYIEAFDNAKESLSLQLYMIESKKKTLPTPTPLEKIGVGKKQVLALVEVDMRVFRAKMKGNYVKKTLTIPDYLNIL